MFNRIIPAIIPESFEDLEEKMSNVLKLVPLVQVDVLDGSLSSVRCWPYQSFTKRDLSFDAILHEEQGFPFWQDLEFEAHLMVKQPEKIIDDWILAGASRIITQLEGADDFKIVKDVVNERVELGIAIALDTPEDRLVLVADEVSIIQLMGWNFSNLGLQGKLLDEKIFEKVKKLRERYPKHIISIDGGVTLENASKLFLAGADRLVVGSALWGNGSLHENLADFKSIAHINGPSRNNN